MKYEPTSSSYKKSRLQKGFTLFVALIVTSLLLAIGFSLSNIVLKQLIFAQSSRESQISFYAADSGAECALYWDRKNQFGTTTVFGAFATSTEGFDSSPKYELLCGYGTDDGGKIGSFNKDVECGGLCPNATAATTTFSVDFQDAVTGSNVVSQKGACAKVTVAKWLDTSSGVPVERTTIDSRGYDAPFVGSVGIGLTQGSIPGDGTCDITSDRVIERAIRVDY